MKKLIITISIIAVCFSCTNQNKATRVLREAGYTDIKITGYNFFCCGKDDNTSTGFKAKGPSGVQVEGCVCCGYFGKSCTIRID